MLITELPLPACSLLYEYVEVRQYRTLLSISRSVQEMLRLHVWCLYCRNSIHLTFDQYLCVSRRCPRLRHLIGIYIVYDPLANLTYLSTLRTYYLYVGSLTTDLTTLVDSLCAAGSQLQFLVIYLSMQQSTGVSTTVNLIGVYNMGVLTVAGPPLPQSMVEIPPNSKLKLSPANRWLTKGSSCRLPADSRKVMGWARAKLIVCADDGPVSTTPDWLPPDTHPKQIGLKLIEELSRLPTVLNICCVLVLDCVRVVSANQLPSSQDNPGDSISVHIGGISVTQFWTIYSWISMTFCPKFTTIAAACAWTRIMVDCGTIVNNIRVLTSLGIR